jgi:uncharacterized protein YcfL
MKKLCLVLVLIFMLTACQKRAERKIPFLRRKTTAESSTVSYSEASLELLSRREAVLKMLEETPDPLSRIENPSHNAPLETVYEENSANGIPQVRL